ncbi:hypothetical protein FGG08_002352 [Glutinoglossum americanum]|uniref:Uncharacterized protein n=1 Tax=Glutinoglossum americanum TaxID=1670608 RepID=A0A9P8L1R4_9PEZI|nr:hypothetical protein FGG08_002352 [Glutinoglossum americanum]
MPLVIRELIQFPDGVNSSDVFINGLHFNRTTLSHWNYTLWSNGTLSNESNCYLVFDQYKPVLLSNGTFLNATSCYAPINHIKSRAILGLVSACLFAASIVFTLINLRKLGRLYLPSEKRFRAVGRRWQWYWLLVLAAFGCISGFMSIDVNRDYLPNDALIYQSFSYQLMMPALLAAEWEAVRHWGSWNERQIVDDDPNKVPRDGVRERKEFWMPLVFYLFCFMNFFMTVPRSWTHIKLQRSLSQQEGVAKPTATDARFKAAAFLAVCAWLVICYSIQHCTRHYKPLNRGLWKNINGFFHYVPIRFFILIPLAAVHIGYAILSAFDFDVSPLKYDSNPGWIYGLGYLPTILVILVMEIWGYISRNEDLKILERRREKERKTDAELGINKKPRWWRSQQDWLAETQQRSRNPTHEIGGGRATHMHVERGLEMGTMTAKPSVTPTTRTSSFVSPAAIPVVQEMGGREAAVADNKANITGSTGIATQGRVRSMLDI